MTARPLARLAALALALLAACASTPETAEDAGASIEFRLVATSAETAVAELPRRDDPATLVPVEEPQRFRVAAARAEVDAQGFPAVYFELADADAERFRAFTAAHVGRELALVHAGQVVTAPRLTGPLPGAGIVSGGAEGFSEAEVTELVAALRGGR